MSETAAGELAGLLLRELDEALDLAATHAAETGHIEAAGTASDLLCLACLVLLQSVAGPRPDADDGTNLEIRSLVLERPAVTPLSRAACTTSSRAPPLAAS